MPRPKNIDMQKLALSKITETLVEEKDCLGVNLVLKNSFPTQGVNMLDSFYKFQVSNGGLELHRSVKNSWKGLVIMFASLAYCKYKDGVVAETWKWVNRSKLKRRCRLRLDFSYESFIGEEEREEMQRKAIPTMSLEDIKAAYQDREEFNRIQEQKRKTAWENLLRSREADSTFEEVPAPLSWKPCYMSGVYEPGDIIVYLKLFSQLLDLDAAASIIETEYSETLPHKYAVFPAKYR